MYTKNEQLFERLKANGLLDSIPSHEIEDLLGIPTDAFDDRKRRHGYPESNYYKGFSCEQAGKEKYIVDQFLKTDLSSKFALEKIWMPGKFFAIIMTLALVSVFSLILWLVFLLRGEFFPAYYSFIIAAAAIFSMSVLNRLKFSGINLCDYYEKARRKEYTGDIPIVPRFENQV